MYINIKPIPAVARNVRATPKRIQKYVPMIAQEVSARFNDTSGVKVDAKQYPTITKNSLNNDFTV